MDESFQKGAQNLPTSMPVNISDHISSEEEKDENDQ